MPFNTLNRHPSHKSRLSLQYNNRTGVSDVQERSHSRASSAQDGQQPASTSNAPGVPTTHTTTNPLLATSKIPTKIPQRRPSSSSLSSQTSSKKSSSMGLGKMIKRTSSKLIGGTAATEKKATTTALPTPVGAPPTPPSSSRGTPSQSTLSRFRSRDSRPGSSNSLHSLDHPTEGQDAPTSVPHKINTITPPVSMLQLAENEAKEYFAMTDANSDHHSDRDVQSIPEEVEEEIEETEIAAKAKSVGNTTQTTTDGSIKEEETNTADTTKETILNDNSNDEQPKKVEQPSEVETKATEVVGKKAERDEKDLFDISKIEVDDSESFMMGPKSPGFPSKEYADSIIEVADSVYELDFDTQETKETEQLHRQPVEEPKQLEEVPEAAPEHKEKQLVKDFQMEEDFEELVIPNGTSTPKEDRPIRLHMDFNLDHEQGTFEVLAEQTEGEESEDESGRRTIEAAKRTLEMLEAQNKPKSPHRDPIQDAFDYSHIPTAESSSAIEDDDVASVVSDFHHPRVSDAISKFEKDIETSAAVAPMRSRTTSYSSNSFHAGMGSPPIQLVRTNSTASSPDHKRPLSRSLSISSSFTVSSRSPSRNGEQSLNSIFFRQNSPTNSQFDFSDKKKRGPSSVYSVSSSLAPSASNESLGARYRFASPTLASSTREQITKTEYEHILSEKDKPRPERPDLRKKASASSAGEYVSKRIRVRLPGGGSSTPGDLTPSRTREQFFNPDSSYMSLNEMKAGSPTPSSYATTATQTESPYPSPPESPTVFEPAPPRLRRMSTSSRKSIGKDFEQDMEDEEDEVIEDVGIDAKVASLLSMFDEDATTIDELVGSLESSMSMLEKEGRRSRSNSIHSRMHSRAVSRAASSAGGGVSRRRSRAQSLYGDDDSDRSRDFRAGSVLSTASTKAGDESESSYISDLRRRNKMRDSPPVSPTPPRTPVDVDMQKKSVVKKPFTAFDVVRIPVRWVADNKGTLFMAFITAIFLLFLYYLQLIKIHRECGFADTYVCSSGGRVCLMRPYSCY